MLTKLQAISASHVKEIRNNTVLGISGAILSFGQILSYLHWLTRDSHLYLTKDVPAMCWPFWNNCFQYRFLNPAEAQILLHIFGLASLMGAVFFLTRFTTLAWWWLLGVNIFKVLILVQDYALRLNQHYMLLFLSLAFLFLPNKKNVLRYTLVMFYFWAGILKLNAEWLSGQALYAQPLFIPMQWIPAACTYVVILELFIVFGLLSKNGWIFWSTLVQCIIFHIVSWPVVHFLYPVLMLSFLCIFALGRYSDPPNQSSLLRKLSTFQEALPVYLFIVLFSLLQVFSKTFPGNTALTGEGRWFALHMFDAQIVCDGYIRLRFAQGITQFYHIPFIKTKRIACDPLVIHSRANQLCHANAVNPQFIDLDIEMLSRLSSEKILRPRLQIHSFCRSNVSYHALKHNKWILTN